MNKLHFWSGNGSCRRWLLPMILPLLLFFCTPSQAAIVPGSTPPIVITNASCATASNGSFTADFDSDSPFNNITYQLDGGLEQISGTFTNLSPGAYTLTVVERDAFFGGIVTTDNIDVIINEDNDMVPPALTCGGPFNEDCTADVSAPTTIVVGSVNPSAVAGSTIINTIAQPAVSVDFAVTPPAGVQVLDITLDVELDHTFIGDLEIELVSPLGTPVLVWDRECGSVDDLDVTFSDAGGTVACASPTTGVITPSNPLAAFAGEDPTGTWTMNISDLAGGDEGTFVGATLNVVFSNTPPVPTRVIPLPAVSDNFPGLITVTSADVTTPGPNNCPNEFTITRTWTATDACGNATTCSQTINVSDNTDPVFATFPADVALQACDASRDPAVTGTPTATDDCSAAGDIMIELTDLPIAAPCPNTGALQRLWTATDECGNTATRIQIINIEDNEPPVLTIPADIALDCEDNTAPGVLIPGSVSASQAAAVSWPDANAVTPAVFTSDIVVSAPAGAMVDDITVSLDLDHSWVGDVDIMLTNPSGTTTVMLLPRSCGSQDNLSATFTDAGAALACGGVGGGAADVGDPDDCSNDYLAGATISGMVLPVDALSSFDGEDPSGTWVLTITDNASGDGGCLINASIDVDYLIADPTMGQAGIATATDNCTGMVDVSPGDVIIPGTCPNSYTIQRTWIATDECGLNSVDTQLITVGDNTDPEFDNATFPADVTIACTDDSSVAALGTPTATDNCSNAALIVITSSDVFTASATCAQAGTLVRTWSAEDECGNIETRDQTITITDNVDPVFDFIPADVTLSCEEDSSVGALGSATATDDCSPAVAITSSDVFTASATCTTAGTLVRTWTATDDCGNTATVDQTITITDDIAPTITCGAGTYDRECSDDISVPATYQVGTGVASEAAASGIGAALDSALPPAEATFNVTAPAGAVVTAVTLDLGITHTFIGDFEIDLVSPGGTTIRLMDNACGGNDNLNLTFADGGDPIATLCASPAVGTAAPVDPLAGFGGEDPNGSWRLIVDDIFGGDVGTLDAAAISVVYSTPPPAFTGSIPLPSVLDNCPGLVTVSSNDVRTDGTCANEYTITRTWTATDACGNATTCSQTINVSDNTAPVITCPAEITQTCDASRAPADTGAPVVSDNCSAVADISVGFSDGPIVGPCANTGAIERTWTATDECGNTATCIQIINVFDSEPPVVTCPADITLNCGDDTSPGAAINGSVSASQAAAVSWPDANAVTPAVFTSDIAVSAPAGAMVEDMTVSIDLDHSWVGDVEIMLTSPSGTTAMLMASGNCGSQDNLSATFTDAGAALACGGVGGGAADVGDPDDCSNDYLAGATISGMVLPVDALSSFDGEDPSGTWVLTITDVANGDGGCLINASVDIDYMASDPNGGGLAGFATAVDNCTGMVSVTHADAITPGSCPGNYIIERTWTAVDECGLVNQCVQTITVVDNAAPTITCPADASVACDGDTSVGALGIATATDDCDGAGVNVTWSDDFVADAACDQRGTLTRTFTATDACGNTATCAQVITITDDTAPVIVSCPANMNLECTDSTDPAFTGSPVGIDACDPAPTASFSDAVAAGACTGESVITRTWTVSDACGNAATCVQILNIFDTTPPMITCPADLVAECSDDYSPGTLNTVTGTETVDAPANSLSWADDISGDIGTVDFAVDGLLPGASVTNVTISMDIDHSWVGDLELALESPGGTVVNLVTDPCGSDDNISATFSDAGAASICAGSISDNGDPDDCSDDYLGGATFSGIVLPESALAAFAGEDPTGTWSLIVFDDAGGDGGCVINASLDVSWTAIVGTGGGGGIASAMDNCDPAPSLTSDDIIIPGACANSFTVQRVWTATDACGNSSTCVQTIIVEDNTAPVITCPADATIECDEDATPTGTGVAAATDNCTTDVTITSSDAITAGDCANSYVITRTWTATDECGNATTCEQTITVSDNVAPVAPAAPAAITVDCAADIPVATPLTATDNCAGDITVMPTFEISDQVCETRFTYTYTWTFDDGCGNVSSVSQTIDVVDSGSITFTSTPANQIVDCFVNVMPQEHLVEATTTTGCASDITITSSISDPIGTPGCNGTRYIVTYTASDDCGRSATTTQRFTIQNDGPQIVCGINTCNIECSVSPDEILAQFNDYVDEAVVVTSCEEAEYTVTHNFNVNAFIGNGCSSETVVTFRATDNCNRFSTCTVRVKLIDDDAPIINGLPSAALRDYTGDAAVTQAVYDNWATIQGQNLNASDNCNTPVVTYSPASPSVTFADNGLAITEVTFTVSDGCGNETSISTAYTLSDNTSVPMGNIHGMMATEYDETVELVDVSLNSESFGQSVMTANDGLYAFAAPMHNNYEVDPYRNDDHRNGISTFDLLLMKQHILGIVELDSPYKMIAADVNRSGTISSLDMIELRRMILLIDDEFSNNTSWRFVDAEFVFPDPTNPFVTTFPEVYQINDLDADTEADFVAVKIGDLNGSAAANELMRGDTRSKDGSLVFNVADKAVNAGETFTVALNANQFNDILGYQFTMKYDARNVEFVDVTAGQLADMNADNFGVHFDKGIITTSWNSDKATSLTDELPVFEVTFKANSRINISEAISLVDGFTAAEAYNANGELLDVDLRFNGATATAGAFKLFQNEPNPFIDVTRIGFELPEAAEATLTIFDVTGKVLYSATGDYSAGYNEEVVDRSDVGADGMLFYRVESGDHVATLKMIVVQKH